MYHTQYLMCFNQRILCVVVKSQQFSVRFVFIYVRSLFINEYDVAWKKAVGRV